VRKIYLSVITIHSGYCETEEMLIPLKIGQILKGFARLKRLDRALPVGHRRRGYEF
jgi:hypothetical protein